LDATVLQFIHSGSFSYQVSVIIVQCCPVQLLWCQLYSCCQLIVKLYAGGNVAPIKHFMAKVCF